MSKYTNWRITCWASIMLMLSLFYFYFPVEFVYNQICMRDEHFYGAVKKIWALHLLESDGQRFIYTPTLIYRSATSKSRGVLCEIVIKTKFLRHKINSMAPPLLCTRKSPYFLCLWTPNDKIWTDRGGCPQGYPRTDWRSSILANFCLFVQNFVLDETTLLHGNF